MDPYPLPCEGTVWRLAEHSHSFHPSAEMKPPAVDPTEQKKSEAHGSVWALGTQSTSGRGPGRGQAVLRIKIAPARHVLLISGYLPRY